MTDVTDVHYWVHTPRPRNEVVVDGRKNFLCFIASNKFFTPVFSSEDIEAVTCNDCIDLLASAEERVEMALVQMERIVPTWYELLKTNRQIRGFGDIEETLERLVKRLAEYRDRVEALAKEKNE